MERARIIVVEDEGIVALDLEDKLERMGYEVVAAVAVGEEAVQKTAEMRPNLVLMDIQLQGAMDGVEAAGQIRERFNIPVVYLTAYSDDRTLRRAQITQPFGYILKPVEERELYTNIEIALYKHKMEQEQVRLERLRALAEMAGGISHNLNNILTGVLGPAQLLLRLADDPRVLRQAQEIATSAWRAHGLIERLSQAVRREENATLHPVALNEAVQQAVQSAREHWEGSAEIDAAAIEVSIEKGEIPPVRGTQSGLCDLLLNLLANAVDAMPHGGTIAIFTRAVEEGVELQVRDTGAGMDEEIRRRVFEPFFTTKMDVGSGLGLSTVHGTVERWGGTIEVESTPGEGTTFTLCFPVWTNPESGTRE